MHNPHQLEYELARNLKKDRSIALTQFEKVQCAVSAAWRLHKDDFKDTIKSAWSVGGQPDGKVDVSRLKASQFGSGKLYRGDGLPTVSDSLIKKMFSLTNLARRPGAPISLPTPLYQRIPDLHEWAVVNFTDQAAETPIAEYVVNKTKKDKETMHQILYTKVVHGNVVGRVNGHMTLTRWGNGKSVFVAEPGANDDDDPNQQTDASDGNSDKELISAVRISTADGQNLTCESIGEKQIAAARNLLDERQKKEDSKEKKTQQLQSEAHVTTMLTTLGFAPPKTKTLTVPMITAFAKANIPADKFRGLRTREDKMTFVRTFVADAGLTPTHVWHFAAPAQNDS